jgi:protein ImuB
VECQVGLADGLFAAVLAARRGVAVGPGDTRAFLAPLGVEELDREPDVDRSELVGLLHRLGLRSLGAFGALDARDVASRFGADAVLAHRLARGLDPRPPVRRHPPEELTVELELDPPVDRVDAAAFAARGLAERLHRTLAGHGLSCTRLGIAARTVGGERLLRVWALRRAAHPRGTVDRVRWQLDSWLTRGGSGAVDRMWLVPEETVTAGELQLGLWGEVGEADERAGRALVRVQALLGPESVVTAVLVGGRDPAERVRLVPWGDTRDGAGAAVAGVTGVDVAPGAGPPVPDAPPEPWAVPEGAGPPAPLPAGDAAPDVLGPRTAADRAPAGWPTDVVRATGLVPATSPVEGAAPPTRPTNRRRRPPARRSTPSAPLHEPPPPWPGRLPAPAPATVLPQPEPIGVARRRGPPGPAGRARPAVRRARPTGPRRPQRRAGGGGVGGPVARAAARWWAGEDGSTGRVQVLCDGGAAYLLAVRGDRWWLTAVYD